MSGKIAGQGRILLVEDEPDIRFSVRTYFEDKGFEVLEAESSASGIEAFRRARPEVAIVDYSLPDGDGLSLLKLFRECDRGVPVLMLTGHGTIDLAVRAIKEGAEQFLTKPVELVALLVLVQRLLEKGKDQRVRLAHESRDSRETDPFLGESRAIRTLKEAARRVLASSSSVLIQGETGSGKGLLAAWIHRKGPRAENPFVDLNCAGLTREFLESELFGHDKGAFTGAVAAKRGLLDIGHRGTVFLDEIGDLPADVQPKLLKVVEEKRFRRLGDVRDREVDVRLIAASHRDLRQLATEGRFREDLYYRLGTLPLRVPPLRERGRDVVLLGRALLERLGADLGRHGVRLSAGAEAFLESYSWPGNVRELRNVLERALLVGDGEVLEVEDLLDGPGQRDPVDVTLAAAEARHIATILAREKGNVPNAARLLGLSRSALYEKLRKHGISAPRAARP